MLTKIGLLVFVVGMANLGHDGGAIALIGLYMIGYGMGQLGGFWLTVILSLPFIGYGIGDGVGFLIGATLLAAGIVFLMRQNEKSFQSKGYALVLGHQVTKRSAIFGTLHERLEGLYPFYTPTRGSNESPQDFANRISTTTRFQGFNQFEVEEVSGEIRCAGGPNVRANFHRIVLYRKPGMYRKTKPKVVVEVKVRDILGMSSSAVSPLVQQGSMLCLDNTAFPASLQKSHSYRLADGSIRIGSTMFLRVVDESGEPYFYPQNIFRDVLVATAA
jgi:hypothetical protein